jgi:hypothetical protein
MSLTAPAIDLDLVPIVSAAPGSYRSGPFAYSSIAAFVRADAARLQSPESDLGLHWRDRGVLYRAAWIEETGEVYIVQLGPSEQGGGHVELLAVGLSRAQLQAALRGWREAHERQELQWLRDRLVAPVSG